MGKVILAIVAAAVLYLCYNGMLYMGVRSDIQDNLWEESRVNKHLDNIDSIVLNVSKQPNLQCKKGGSVSTEPVQGWWEMIAKGSFKECNRYHAILRDSSSKGLHVSFDYSEKSSDGKNITNVMLCEPGGKVIYKSPRLPKRYAVCD